MAGACSSLVCALVSVVSDVRVYAYVLCVGVIRYSTRRTEFLVVANLSAASTRSSCLVRYESKNGDVLFWGMPRSEFGVMLW